MTADQPACAITRRYDLVILAWRNSADDRTAQRLANRLAESWFGCTCEELASRQPPPESIMALIADLPCSVRLIEAERQTPPVFSDQAIERLANAIQSFFCELWQVPDLSRRQVSQAPRPLPQAKGKP